MCPSTLQAIDHRRCDRRLAERRPPHRLHVTELGPPSNGSDSCVEARTDRAGIQIRDSKDRRGPVLSFHQAACQSFLAALTKGNLNRV
ncbi:DUF397 domain-containing protein [Micromonospora sp. NPDC049679]|uniref:DUF397 domain-containing protein n=1 Tax=Micromonospora sp. NPDC049679 TaxID=3155920 RepID=UPI0033C4FEBD